MEFKDIIQINATIIVGILILLTTASFVEHSDNTTFSHIAYGYSILAFGLSMVSAIVGQIMTTMGTLKKESTMQRFKGFALVTLAFGVIYLTGAILELLKT